MASDRFHRTLFVLVTCGCVLAGCGGHAQPEVVAQASGTSGASGGEQSTSAAGAEAAEAAPGAVPRAASGAGGVLVDVAGHVRQPGVYRLEPGARVHEAIAAAGGPKSGARLAALNRAATVVDGQQVLVPGPGDSTGEGGGAAAAAGGTSMVSINSADVSALDALPGIGPVTAERIVTEREQGGPFASIDDLERVPGVGPATIEALRDVATT